ncbi:lytic transglycosylase domain-containing protein [Xanthobacter pseudotagetidis]|uniref:lytic transglycosylase domain-containing protein n=1 Tax=Xanthobacter pseudotagetidis TaxID=3119911 RepID=UPI003726542B
MPTGELSTLKSAVAAARSGKGTEALAMARDLDDEVARTLVTWLVIRHAPNDIGFNGINAFLQEKPGWPTQNTLRRRAERMLFQEKRDPATIRAFFAQQPPISGEGKIALARALMATGSRSDAADWLREAWYQDDLNENFEEQVLAEFGSLLTRADHKARADRFSYTGDSDRALRAAKRAGSDVVALTKARLAVMANASSAGKLLAQVPFTLTGDPAFQFAKGRLLRRDDKPAEAASALLQGAKSQNAALAPDQWWIERRFVARDLIDAGDARTAYRIAATGVEPEANNYRAEQQFTAGWIALRFLKDPRTASQHFAAAAEGQSHPITLARAYYWQGRAAAAAGDRGTAQARFQAAAQFSTAYYGQLARTELGVQPVALRNAAQPSFSDRNTFPRIEAVKAIRLLYAIGERDIPLTIYYDLAWNLKEPGQLTLLAELAQANGDARGALAVGRESLGDGGMPTDLIAFPTSGLPNYASIGTPVDKAMVYAVARQESHFHPGTVSSAKAMGLMQVTPAAGRQVAKVTGATYNEARLMSDQSYNVQFGAAELGELWDIYDGNCVLVFAAYNAGRGNVRKWIERFGDPRDPDVDVVDWVERIPFGETRNYVQRVMENYQVYKVRFNIPTKLQLEADLRGGKR